MALAFAWLGTRLTQYHIITVIALLFLDGFPLEDEPYECRGASIVIGGFSLDVDVAEDAVQ